MASDDPKDHHHRYTASWSCYQLLTWNATRTGTLWYIGQQSRKPSFSFTCYKYSFNKQCWRVIWTWWRGLQAGRQGRRVEWSRCWGTQVCRWAEIRAEWCWKFRIGRNDLALKWWRDQVDNASGCTTLLLLLLHHPAAAAAAATPTDTHTQGRSRWGRTEGGRRAEKTQTQPGCHRSTLTQALWWMMNKQHFPILASFASLLFPAPPVRAWWLHDGNIKKSWILFKEVVIKVKSIFPSSRSLVIISILLCWLYLRAVWHASWAAVWQADPLTQTRPRLSSELLVRFTAAKVWHELSAQRRNRSSQVSIHASEVHSKDKYLNSFFFLFFYNHTCSHKYFKRIWEH